MCNEDHHHNGLTSAEAASRLAQCGPNDLAAARASGVLRELLRSLASPLMLILLVLAALAVEAWAIRASLTPFLR